MESHHHHPRHPEEQDVMSGLQQRAGIEELQFFGLKKEAQKVLTNFTLKMILCQSSFKDTRIGQTCIATKGVMTVQL